MVGGSCRYPTGQAAEDRPHDFCESHVERQDMQLVSTTGYPKRYWRVSDTNPYSAWQWRLRAREDVNYTEVDEFEDDDWSHEAETGRETRQSSSTRSTSSTGSTSSTSKSHVPKFSRHPCARCPQPIIRTANRMPLRKDSMDGSGRRPSTSIKITREGNKSFLVGFQPRLTSTGIGSRVRQETHAPLENDACGSVTDDPEMVEILRKLHQLEEDTKAPKTCKHRRYSSAYIAVPPWMLEREKLKKKTMGTGEDAKGGKEEVAERETQKSRWRTEYIAKNFSVVDAVSTPVQEPNAGMTFPPGKERVEETHTLHNSERGSCTSPQHDKSESIQPESDERVMGSLASATEGITRRSSSAEMDDSNAGREPKRQVAADSPGRLHAADLTLPSLEASPAHCSPSGATQGEFRTRFREDNDKYFCRRNSSENDSDECDDLDDVRGVMPGAAENVKSLEEHGDIEHGGVHTRLTQIARNPSCTSACNANEASTEGRTGRTVEELAVAGATSGRQEEGQGRPRSGVSGWMKRDSGRKRRSAKPTRTRKRVLHHKLVFLNRPSSPSKVRGVPEFAHEAAPKSNWNTARSCSCAGEETPKRCELKKDAGEESLTASTTGLADSVAVAATEKTRYFE